MAKRKILFHFYRGGNFGAWVIRARLGSAFAHVAAQFEDGIVYHSTMLEGNHKSYPKQLEKPAHTVTLELDDASYQRAYAYAKSVVGVKYDFKAIWGFVIGRRVEDANGLFCSEHCRNIFETATGVKLKYYTLISPEALYGILSAHVASACKH